jgi:hypothetical protein
LKQTSGRVGGITKIVPRNCDAARDASAVHFKITEATRESLAAFSKDGIFRETGGTSGGVGLLVPGVGEPHHIEGVEPGILHQRDGKFPVRSRTAATWTAMRAAAGGGLPAGIAIGKP